MHRLRKAVLPLRPPGKTPQGPPQGPPLHLSGQHGVRHALEAGSALPEHSQQRGCEVVHQEREHCHLRLRRIRGRNQKTWHPSTDVERVIFIEIAQSPAG